MNDSGGCEAESHVAIMTLHRTCMTEAKNNFDVFVKLESIYTQNTKQLIVFPDRQTMHWTKINCLCVGTSISE